MSSDWLRQRKQVAKPVRTTVDIEAWSETEGEPLSPSARLFHAPGFNCCIIAVMGCKTKVDVNAIKAGLKQTLLKHPRFSSKLIRDNKKPGRMKWVETTVDLEDHLIIPNLDSDMDKPDQFVEDYVSGLSQTKMDMSKPLWELHILTVKTSEAESVGIFRIHHSIGDGASLVSLLLACTRKTSDPNTLPTLPRSERAPPDKHGGFRGLVTNMLSIFYLVWNTFVDLLMFAATVVFLKDTETPIKGSPGVESTTKRFIHRTVNLNDIKMVKRTMNMTINDVVLGITQAGLSRYLNKKYGEKEKDESGTKKRNSLPERIRLRSTLLVNLRPSTGIQALADMMEKNSKVRWGNWISYVLLPFTISLKDDPLDYVREAKATINRKKLSLESLCTYSAAELLVKLFGAKAGGTLSHKVLFNTTLSFSNVVGPIEEISFYGHPLSYFAPSVYGHPQALTLHFQSYMDKMTISLAVDPEVIPDPHQLCDELEESLKLIKDAVVRRGLII